MIKTLAAANKSERVKVKVPRSVQQSIPIKRIYTNGIWEVGNKHSRSWKLTDVNYIAASQETRESIFSAYCGALNSMPTDATAKITIVNHRLNPAEFERRILFPYKDDWLDHYREEANGIMKGRAAQSNNLVQERFVTLSIPKRKIEESKTYFRRAGANLQKTFVVIMGVASMLTSTGDGRSAYVPVSAEVEAYRPLIRLYAAEHGIPEYEDLIAAVMMQESGGQGTDPMQCSECGFNTRYPHYPNGITDPEYSIDVGIQNLADCMHLSGVESPIDLDRISLGLQGYNYGSGYISWALANYGGYSELNAIEFSDMMAARIGSSGYGDKAYVSHVLHYYPIGRSFMGEGNAAMVAVAQSQIGNVGGAPYWSWWGLDYRVEWCAIFVSWCADQCGYLDAGVLPKMEGVRPYVDWFIERGQWQGRDYEPSPGDIIFFDWESDGLADHVGIVERVENGLIYTVEGNSGDVCAERRYTLGAAPVYGFGLPLY